MDAYNPTLCPTLGCKVTADPIVDKLYESTEEGQKVVRNKKAGQNHGDGDVRVALFRKVVDPGL